MQNKSLNAGFAVILISLALAGAFSINLFLKQRIEKDSVNINNLAYTIAEWKGKDIEPEEGTYDILGTRNLLLREYINGSGIKAYLLVIYSETKRDHHSKTGGRYNRSERQACSRQRDIYRIRTWKPDNFVLLQDGG
jgi:hypothetical protein